MKAIKAKHQAYLSDLRIPEGTSGAFKVSHSILSKGTKETVVSMRNALFMGLEPLTVTLQQNTVLHSLTEDGGIWMTDHLQEVEQHTRQTRRFYGDVLVGGLGLGLAVKLLEDNRQVESITVVELSSDVLSLVAPHLQARKTSFIQGDLYEYLKSTQHQYDCAFYDIWCPTGQRVLTEHVLPLRRASVGIIPQRHIECWNEKEMVGQVAHALWGATTMTSWLYGLDESRFQAMRDAHTETYPFLSWLRKKRPTPIGTKRAMNHYLHNFLNPPEWDKRWAQYQV